MPIDGPDRFGKQIAVAVEVKPEEKRFGEFADQDEVVSYVRKRLVEFEPGSADDILIDDMAGPATMPSGKNIAEGLSSLRLISHFREIKERNIESEIGELVDLYESIYGASGEAEGMKTAHRLFMERLYPSDYLPVMEAVSTYLDEQGNLDKTQLVRAVDDFADAMRPVRELSQKERISLYDAFLDLYDESLNGRNDLLSRLNKAGNEAYRCVNEYRKLMRDIWVAQRADNLIMKHEELEKGLEFTPEFVEKLNSPETKTVVISLDFNSTFNSKESYSAMELVARAQRELSSFTRAFRRKYPEKELLMVINTGRPGLYAWGVAESSFAPIAELRKVAVAESGGVVLDRGLNTGAMSVAVENPEEWKEGLDRLKEYLLSQIDNPQKVAIEPKMSMLSMKLAEHGQYILKTNDGREVTPTWIGGRIKRFFESEEVDIESKWRELIDELFLAFPDLETHTIKAVKDFDKQESGENSGEVRKKIIEGLREAIPLMNEEHQKRLAEIESGTKILDMMYRRGALAANYNPTAGYVDIGHKDVNKFSTLMGHVTKTRVIEPERVLYVQIGDSTTDILPAEKTGIGEPNEGAEKAFLIAVNNCNEKMQTAVEDRGQYGLFTRNQSILGVEAMFKGLRKLVSRRGDGR